MYALYGHGGSGNHGCEAIVRTTASLLNKKIRLFSLNPQEDEKYEIDRFCKILEDEDHYSKRGSLFWLCVIPPSALKALLPVH